MREEEHEKLDAIINGAKGDCPEDLIKLAKSPFEKAVVIEFFNLHKTCIKIKSEIKWIKWIVISIFGLTAIATVVQIITKFLGM